MSSPSTLARLPPELWHSIFIQINDPIYILRTCRIVSRDFNRYTKAYFKTHLIPTRTEYSLWSGVGRPHYKGMFSGFCTNGDIVRFNIFDQTVPESRTVNVRTVEDWGEWLLIEHTRPPAGPIRDCLYGYATECSGQSLTSRVVALRVETRDQLSSSEEGLVKLFFDLDEGFVEFVWWDLFPKVFLGRNLEKRRTT